MNMIIGLVRRFAASWTGSRFANTKNTEDNGTTTYTFSGRSDSDKGRGGKLKLQPVSVRTK
ncbi:hypothetical protein WBG78_12000 [Chryseolinea sp. T2]|uniref:hypothetical protein n=1 Tax=Chryseolinea sp. T2 TaxID=3129255 RepID=UPI0030783A5A